MTDARPFTVTVDCATGEVVERPLSDAEYARWQADQAAAAAARLSPPSTLAEQVAAAVAAGIAAVQPLSAAQAAAVDAATAAALDPERASTPAIEGTIGPVTPE